MKFLKTITLAFALAVCATGHSALTREELDARFKQVQAVGIVQRAAKAIELFEGPDNVLALGTISGVFGTGVKLKRAFKSMTADEFVDAFNIVFGNASVATPVDTESEKEAAPKGRDYAAECTKIIRENTLTFKTNQKGMETIVRLYNPEVVAQRREKWGECVYPKDCFTVEINHAAPAYQELVSGQDFSVATLFKKLGSIVAPSSKGKEDAFCVYAWGSKQFFPAGLHAAYF